MKKIAIMMALLLGVGTLFGCNQSKEPEEPVVDNGTVGGEPTAFADTDTYLVNNGQSNYKVVIPESATITEKYAAEELVYFLEQSTACKLPIITDKNLTASESDCYLSVGETVLYEAQPDLAVSYEELGERGVSVHTKGNTAIMVGATDNGTLFSVYRFLYYQIGYTAYGVDCIDYEQYSKLKLKAFDYKYVPGIEITTGSDMEIAGEANTKNAMRMYLSTRYDLTGDLYNGLWCHTNAWVVPIEQYPDLWNNAQLCYTNPKTVEVVTQNIIDKYLMGAGPYIMLGGNDDTGSCGCANCLVENEKYGGAAGAYVKFMNAVAENIETYMQENGMTARKIIVGLNYYAYIAPPVVEQNGQYVPIDESVVPRNGQVSVGIMFTPINYCCNHSLGDENCESNAQYAEYLKGWDAITDYLMAYVYETNFGALRFHFNNWMHMGDTYRLLSEADVKYLSPEANHFNGISPMSTMRIYLRSALSWNPYYDTEDLIKKFMVNYYGMAADSVEEYFYTVMEYFERIYTMSGTECQGCFYHVSKKEYWTRDVLLNLESILEKGMYDAERSNSVNKDIYRERVYKEYFLLKDIENEYYSAYLDAEQQAALKKLVEEGRAKYGVIQSSGG